MLLVWPLFKQPGFSVDGIASVQKTVVVCRPSLTSSPAGTLTKITVSIKDQKDPQNTQC